MDWEKEESLKLVALLLLNSCGLAVAQMDNYYNWPESEPPVVKTEVHMAGRDTRVRCQLRERFRHVQNNLNLTWEHKPCRAGHSLGCLKGGSWSPLCGAARTPCPPILSILDPRAQDSGLYRCHITLDSIVIPLNVYMLQFVEKRREPPVIMEGPWSNVSIVAPLVVALQCQVWSTVPPTVRWFRRINPAPTQPETSLNLIQYLNNTYQMLNCCMLAVQSSQKDVYISKLVISPSAVTDSGFYVCLAINDANYTYREAYVHILPLIKAAGTKAETTSFLGLFLIPAGFAMVPAIVWVLYLRPRTPVSKQCAPPLVAHTRLLPVSASKL